jgi:hypothetical protein
MEDKDIQKLKESRGFFNFNGVLVERIIGGYRCFGSTFSNEIDLINHIQETCSILNESITIKNHNGNWETSNTERDGK